ncbi:energy transducer TonB [Spongiimicrobium salis]|uniref:energy transducer TonB n=1 Tax=Spongiimicrobium salis TaxID=1667022 RepID=UPI00374CCD1A
MKKHTAKTVAAHGNGSNSEANRNAKPKGSKHDANLRKRGSQRFQLGLILALLLVYIGLEASFRNVAPIESKDSAILEVSLIEVYPELEKIRVEQPKEPEIKPQRKIVNPDTFKVVDNDTFVEEAKKVVEVIEVPKGEFKITEIPDEEEDIIDEVPFILVEDVPIFPGCEKVEKSERRTCFNEKMKKHVKRYFRYPEAAQEIGQQGRVDVLFKIDTDGTVTDVQMRGPAKILEKEAARIIGKLPKMTPGKQRGNAVRVPFSIPITFKLN